MDTPSRTVVFVTGAFVTHHCWDDWKVEFARHGYSTFAPPHPNKDGDAVALRSQHPDSPIAENRLESVLGAYVDFIRALPEKPILVGHSYGGLLTQLLLQRDLGVAGIAIDSVPPRGVFTMKWSFIRAATPALGLFTSANTTYLMTFQQWQYAFTNGMTLAQQLDSYSQFVVPESKRFSRDALGRHARIDFHKPHAPLLFIAGEQDHIIPASLNHTNYLRYHRHPESITEFVALPGRNHFVLGQSHWRETAGYALDWIDRLATRLEPARERPAIEMPGGTWQPAT